MVLASFVYWWITLMGRFCTNATKGSVASSTGPNLIACEVPIRQEAHTRKCRHWIARLRTCGIIVLQTQEQVRCLTQCQFYIANWLQLTKKTKETLTDLFHAYHAIPGPFLQILSPRHSQWKVRSCPMSLTWAVPDDTPHMYNHIVLRSERSLDQSPIAPIVWHWLK